MESTLFAYVKKTASQSPSTKYLTTLHKKGSLRHPKDTSNSLSFKNY